MAEAGELSHCPMAMGDEKPEQDCRKVVVEAAHWVTGSVDTHPMC